MNENYSVIKQWIIKAEHDFLAINVLLQNSPQLTDIICLHCQQCSEKYIKAYILSLNHTFSFGDEFLKLLNQLSETVKIDSEVFKWAADIDRFGISIRHPSLEVEPTLHETKLIVESTNLLRIYFNDLLKDFLDD